MWARKERKMPEYPFEHKGPVHLASTDNYEHAYYYRDGKFYTCYRQAPLWRWEIGAEKEIEQDIFWMTVACIERKPHHA